MLSLFNPLIRTISNPLSRGLVYPLGGSSLPPVTDELLVWLEGDTTDTERIDSYKTPGDFPMALSQSSCLLFDGVSDRVVFPTRLDTGNIIEISLWFIVGDETITYSAAVGQGQLDWEIFIRPASNKIAVYYGDGSTSSNVAVDCSIFNDHEPHFLSCVLNKTTGVFTVSLDSIAQGSNTGASLPGGIHQNLTFSTRSGGTTYPFSGQLWDVKINNIHFPLAERSPTATHVFDTTGAYSGELITTDLALMRSGRQDVFFPHETLGWWEIDGDDTMYPYAVDGFTIYHPGNTWNNSGVLQGFVERPVGTFTAGSDNISFLDRLNTESYIEIEFDLSRPDFSEEKYIVTQGSKDWAILFTATHIIIYYGNGITYYSATIELIHEPSKIKHYKVTIDKSIGEVTVTVDGVLHTSNGTSIAHGASNSLSISGYNVSTSLDMTFRKLRVSDGVEEWFFPLNEGQGTDIHDSEGNIVGELITTDEDAFWANTQLDQEIIDMDADYHMFSDSNGHALPVSQGVLEELGGEEITGGNCENDIPHILNTNLNGNCATVGIDTSISHTGSSSIKVTGDGVIGNSHYECRFYVSSIATDKVFRIGAWVYVPSTTLASSLNFYDLSNSSGSTMLDSTNERDKWVFLTGETDGDLGNRIMWLYLNGTVDGGGEFYVDDMTIREVNPLINNNDQYFMKVCENKPTELALYQEKLTGSDLTKARAWACIPDTALNPDDTEMLNPDDSQTVNP